MGRRQVGTVWETDSGGDSSVCVAKMSLFEMFYLTDTLIVTNRSVILNVFNMINN